jgi:hypothetical protein
MGSSKHNKKDKKSKRKQKKSSKAKQSSSKDSTEHDSISDTTSSTDTHVRAATATDNNDTIMTSASTSHTTVSTADKEVVSTSVKADKKKKKKKKKKKIKSSTGDGSESDTDNSGTNVNSNDSKSKPKKSSSDSSSSTPAKPSSKMSARERMLAASVMTFDTIVKHAEVQDARKQERMRKRKIGSSGMESDDVAAAGGGGSKRSRLHESDDVYDTISGAEIEFQKFCSKQLIQLLDKTMEFTEHELSSATAKEAIDACATTIRYATDSAPIAVDGKMVKLVDRIVPVSKKTTKQRNARGGTSSTPARLNGKETTKKNNAKKSSKSKSSKSKSSRS